MREGRQIICLQRLNIEIIYECVSTKAKKYRLFYKVAKKLFLTIWSSVTVPHDGRTRNGRQTNKRMEGWTDGQTDGRTNEHTHMNVVRDNRQTYRQSADAR